MSSRTFIHLSRPSLDPGARPACASGTVTLIMHRSPKSSSSSRCPRRPNSSIDRSISLPPSDDDDMAQDAAAPADATAARSVQQRQQTRRNEESSGGSRRSTHAPRPLPAPVQRTGRGLPPSSPAPPTPRLARCSALSQIASRRLLLFLPPRHAAPPRRRTVGPLRSFGRQSVGQVGSESGYRSPCKVVNSHPAFPKFGRRLRSHGTVQYRPRRARAGWLYVAAGGLETKQATGVTGATGASSPTIFGCC
ncbi:hypothetical protein MPTK1_1g03550 [Marchantia polymorpha subsp. ruderalis]|uniref:Uncharacterized protein n=2 Tax=Marchantia polymorpha TaxID=3197 RepID=A0AAF6AL53_MARPO|nr:hypothetical protein MARPO_0005s0252 [Marchantia polymorpha]BBM97173.1 hypothetical protein Mp_1g03550 [Marchantia polymorpha subsp. ruderalis]|eukprot:PTQ48633.1 hypothetical protein MARPO_0005s0252 [Marchantia polymorpha]